MFNEVKKHYASMVKRAEQTFTVLLLLALMSSALLPLLYSPSTVQGHAEVHISTLRQDIYLPLTLLEKTKVFDPLHSLYEYLSSSVYDISPSKPCIKRNIVATEPPVTLASLLIYSQTTSSFL
jgi:hypothetical protein